MFENAKKFKTTFANKKLVVETGKFAQLANGECLIRYADTVVHVAVTASKKPRDGIDFFPLSVDFEEKLYSVGKIPGSYSKREGKPSEKAILTSRVIDRPIRPLFPKDMRNDVSVVCTVMSVDKEAMPEVAAMIGTSVALSISDIPWSGPISGVNVGLINGKYIINPSEDQKSKSDLWLTVASTEKLVTMIEAGAKEVTNEVMLQAITEGHKANQEIIEFIKSIKNEIGKEKFSYESHQVPEELQKEVCKLFKNKIKMAFDTTDKKEREQRLDNVYNEVHEQLANEDESNLSALDESIYNIQKDIVRSLIINEKKRVDGRSLDEIRPLASEVALLPRVHGSGLFTRGQTQVLTVATLGPISDKQLLDGIDSEDSKRYMHQYNFPSYSVGETRPSRAPGRREIGHGALAERALLPVIPSVEEFPYAYRLVSEVLSSNGSTSQASVCASTLALMDAGVPIKSPVAGISCGLITQGEDYTTIVDIQGVEDFFGDMDFKVAGTRKGITAIQMDLKIEGLTKDIIKEALEKTYKARLFILDEVMLKTIAKPRNEISKYAPKVVSTNVPIEKIRDVIGSGGKVVQKLCTDFEVTIDIEEDGTVFISGLDMSKCKEALETVESIVKEPEVGSICKGIVTRITEFGAFVEISPGKEGMVHVSKLDVGRINKVSDVVKVGEKIMVKITDIDEKGRINLSRKDALMEIKGINDTSYKKQISRNDRSSSNANNRRNRGSSRRKY